MMKSRSQLLLAAALVVSLLVAERAWTKVEYNSNQLLMMNAEQITALVIKKIKTAHRLQKEQEVDDDRGIQAEPGAVESLKDALRIVLSRPDQDGARANLFARVRRELTDLNAFNDSIKDLTEEGITGIRNPKTALRHQATYMIMLENLIAEAKPEIGANETFLKAVTDIRDANLEISEKLRTYELVRSMRSPVSPSRTAEILVPKKDPKTKEK